MSACSASPSVRAPALAVATVPGKRHPPPPKPFADFRRPTILPRLEGGVRPLRIVGRHDVFRRLLIANRGEIACRITRTAKRLGLHVIAVHSEADREALHVRLADESLCVGPPPARESYLNVDAILDAARRTGADAVHPGYGFLSESSDFARRVSDNGLIFVGPGPEAIRLMGSKSEAKAIAAEAGAPLVPGYHGSDNTPETLARAATEIGYPVLVKASAGGGGRGMRIVNGPGDLPDAIESASREALRAFGDGSLLLERHIPAPRHVEVQVLADSHGSVLHLFDRDCSVQRRYQKIIEEAPAPGLPGELREAMSQAAVRLTRAIGYVGAGTVEFLVADGSFHFIEMNTRIQVEHPVTEAVTGLDLVEEQLKIAAGEPLGFGQSDIAAVGHAVEARLYAEDPARDFLPQTGRLDHLAFPAERPAVRIDTGVALGDAITPHYDPMIAKIIGIGRDREQARLALSEALAGTEIVGLATNLPFLVALVRHPAFAAGDLDTHFIERHGAVSLEPPSGDRRTMLVLAALAVMEDRGIAVEADRRTSEDPHSPWWRSDSWRLNDDGRSAVTVRDGGERTCFEVTRLDDGYRFESGEGEEWIRGVVRGPGASLVAEIDGHRRRGAVVVRGTDLTVFLDGGRRELVLDDPGAVGMAADVGGSSLTSPMPGTVVRLLVEVGQEVRKGTPLLVLEAMKMEHTIAAPADGTVETLAYGVGDQVEEGIELVGFRGADA